MGGVLFYMIRPIMEVYCIFLVIFLLGCSFVLCAMIFEGVSLSLKLVLNMRFQTPYLGTGFTEVGFQNYISL